MVQGNLSGSMKRVINLVILVTAFLSDILGMWELHVVVHHPSIAGMV